MEKIKAFVLALKEHLLEDKYKYTGLTEGGYDFCGDTQMEPFFDTEAMMHEIDVFAESFQKHEDMSLSMGVKHGSTEWEEKALKWLDGLKE